MRARQTALNNGDGRVSLSQLQSAKKTGRRDVLTPEQRSHCMSRIRGKDTGPERLLASLLIVEGLSWDAHCADLPGRPDFVFRAEQLAVFVDGDFWHGWRLPRWRHKLTPYWAEKIARNRRRDRSNHAKLRRRGWKVMRIWEHQLKRDAHAAVARIACSLAAIENNGR